VPYRAPCLEDAAKHDQAKIVFDLDDSLRSWDRQQMIELTRAAGVMDWIAYEHRTRYSEGPPVVDVVGHGAGRRARPISRFPGRRRAGRVVSASRTHAAGSSSGSSVVSS
jgi:hypothetical protein